MTIGEFMISDKIIEARIKYSEAKDYYYNNTDTIISDIEFDELEEWLKDNDPDFKMFVGAPTKEDKHTHWSPMLSLDKIQIKPNAENKSDIVKLTEDISEWSSVIAQTSKNNVFEITPKYDGVSINIQYINGALSKAITRGDKIKGRDITERVKGLIPDNIITDYEYVEIRGEILMPIDVFESKYKKDFKNARNIVAGMLAQKDSDFNFSDLFVMPFECRFYDTDKNQVDINNEHQTILNFLQKNWQGFEPFYIVKDNIIDVETVNSIWCALVKHREESKFQLDGFVIKSNFRHVAGENNTHPKWAKAIKFLPKKTITTIIEIEWILGKTGEFTPVAILEPVDLDGSTVQRASLHNLGTIQRLKTSVGAQVSIEKKGDIIPQVTEVVVSSDQAIEYPLSCPHCATSTIADSIRVVCPNIECTGVKKLKFISGVLRLEYDMLGDKNAGKLYDTGLFETVFDIFNREIMNVPVLVNSGQFSDGKIVRKIVETFSRKRDIDIVTVIRLMDIDRIGSTTAKKLSEYLSFGEADFSGLEKAIIESFTEGELNMKFNEIVNKLEGFGMSIKKEEVKKVAKGGTFEMTGSPKSAGWTVKNKFVEDAANCGFGYDKLSKDSRYLLTDNYNSKSSKMAKATKLGVEIITYEDFKNKYLGV